MSIQGLNNSTDVRVNRGAIEPSRVRETRTYQDIRFEPRVSISTNSISTQTDPTDTGDIPPPMAEGGNGVARHDWLQDRIDSLQAVVDLANDRKDALNDLVAHGTPEQKAAAREVLRQIRVAERELSRDQRELDWLEEMDTSGRFRYQQQPVAPEAAIIGSEQGFGDPSTTAETLNGGRGRASGTGDVILNDVSGDIAMRRDGSSLFVGEYEIQNAFDEDGKMVRRVYLRGGEVNQPYFSNMNENNIAANRDNTGAVIGGIKFSARATNPTATANPPFPSDSSWRADTASSTNDEIVYRKSGSLGNSIFTAPSSYRGQPVRAVEVLEDPNHRGDVLVKLRSTPQGAVLATYRLVNAKQYMENIGTPPNPSLGTLKFQGGEVGQYWNAATVNLDWTGGNGGHNMIRFKGGHIQAGNGGDYLKQEGSGAATILGGSGNDFIVGGGAETGALTIDGGDGNDFIFGGGKAARGSFEKTLRGNAGNDVIIVDGDDPRAHVDGGEGGFDYSNSKASDSISIEDNALARESRRVIDWSTTNTPDSTADASMRAYYRSQVDNMTNALNRGSDAIYSGAMGIFRSKETEFAGLFSGGTSSLSDTNTTWQHPTFGSGTGGTDSGAGA
ncbi:MAG: calcium-binding protein [Deltaproteobacteria bacterium]|nr:MAG: calcium-binding protein [Deltaproteobacteria bacterium]